MDKKKENLLVGSASTLMEEQVVYLREQVEYFDKIVPSELNKVAEDFMYEVIGDIHHDTEFPAYLVTRMAVNLAISAWCVKYDKETTK